MKALRMKVVLAHHIIVEHGPGTRHAVTGTLAVGGSHAGGVAFGIADADVGSAAGRGAYPFHAFVQTDPLRSAGLR